MTRPPILRGLVLLLAVFCLNCTEESNTNSPQADTQQADTQQADTQQADTQQADTQQADSGSSDCPCSEHSDCEEGFCKGGVCQPPLQNDECWSDDGVCSLAGNQCIGENICPCDTPCALATQPGTCVYFAPFGGEHTFILSNQSEASVWIQTQSAEEMPTWYSVYANGEPLPLHDSCAIPNCQEPGDAGVCGASLPEAQELASGDSIEWVWEGMAWGTGVGPNGTCEYKGAGVPGQVTLRFCWGTEAQEGEVLNPECADLSLTYGGTITVTHNIE